MAGSTLQAPIPLRRHDAFARVRGLLREAAATWRLTPRELQVLAGVVVGMTDHAIASQFGLSTRTVEDHVGHLLAKAGAENRTDLAIRALQLNRSAP